MFDREIFFDEVRRTLFGGSLTQQQVDGLNFKLGQWELHPYHPTDLRWLSYPLATSKHETASTMWPIEEFGKGAGAVYGRKDPQTGQIYFGRGDVQLTWRDNYKRGTDELELRGADDLEWHADRALDPKISADVMFMGMREGWFRKKDGRPCNLARYFNANTDDAFEAREIINGDKNKVPSWSKSSIGNLIKGYHLKFLDALEKSYRTPILPEPPLPEPPLPEPPLPEPLADAIVDMLLAVQGRVRVSVSVNGVVLGSITTTDDDQ